jgi:hypothetical protein
VCLFLLIFYELCRFTTSESNTLQEESHEKPSEPIQVDDDDAVEDTQSRPKRRHTSAVWKEFKEVEIMVNQRLNVIIVTKNFVPKAAVEQNISIATWRYVQ